MSIKEKLEGVIIGMTDKVTHFPCVAGRPHVEYPGFHWWRWNQGRGDNKHMTNSLFLPVANKTYKEIAENLYEALTEKKVDLFTLSNKDRKVLYDTIISNPSYNFIRNRNNYD